MSIDRRNRWRRRWSAGIFGLLFAVLGSPLFAEPCSGTAPPPTGPFPVSSWSRDFVDSAREETLTEGGPRRYTVTFYYPASGAAAGLQPYASGLEAEAIRTSWPIPEGFAARFCLPLAAKGSAVADGKFPMVVFSPGLSWSSVAYRSILIDLASRGYVVAAVTHPHATSLAVFHDGSTVDMSRWPKIDDEVERQAFLADYLATWVADLEHLGRKAISGEAFEGGPVADHVEMSRGMGLLGHSYGASAAARTLDGQTFRAALAMEGRYRGPQTPPVTPRGPLMHMIGGYNRIELEGNQYTPGTHPLYEVVVDGAWHASFSDLVLLYSATADDEWHARHHNELRPDRVIQIARSYAGAFFDAWLKGIDSPYLHPRSTAARLDGPKAGGFPEAGLTIDVLPGPVAAVN